MRKQDLREALQQAMRAKDELRLSVLRMLISAITYYEIEKGGAGYEATEDDVLSVIGKQVKQRKDSIEQFTQAGRKELADKEQAEMAILSEYLPLQLSDEEVEALITQAIADTGAQSVADMGKVMGKLSPLIKGKADAGSVSTRVRQLLSV
jgi:hypothetical protein